MKKFNNLLLIEKYIHWEVSPEEHVILFKNGNRFLLSHSKGYDLVSVVFDLNDEKVDVIECEGIEKDNFDFDDFYTNIQKKTKNVEGFLI